MSKILNFFINLFKNFSLQPFNKRKRNLKISKLNQDKDEYLKLWSFYLDFSKHNQKKEKNLLKYQDLPMNSA